MKWYEKQDEFNAARSVALKRETCQLGKYFSSAKQILFLDFFELSV
jgi:hypothetical protein